MKVKIELRLTQAFQQTYCGFTHMMIQSSHPSKDTTFITHFIDDESEAEKLSTCLRMSYLDLELYMYGIDHLGILSE